MKKGSDWLRHQSQGKKRESGVSVLDMVKLSPNQRRIVRVLLREVQMTYSDLFKAVEAMPEAERIDLEAPRQSVFCFPFQRFPAYP